MQNIPYQLTLEQFKSIILKQLDISSSAISVGINMALSAVSCHGIPIISKRDRRRSQIRTRMDVTIESSALRRGYRQRQQGVRARDRRDRGYEQTECHKSHVNSACLICKHNARRFYRLRQRADTPSTCSPHTLRSSFAMTTTTSSAILGVLKRVFLSASTRSNAPNYEGSETGIPDIVMNNKLYIR